MEIFRTSCGFRDFPIRLIALTHSLTPIVRCLFWTQRQSASGPIPTILAFSSHHYRSQQTQGGCHRLLSARILLEPRNSSIVSTSTCRSRRTSCSWLYASRSCKSSILVALLSCLRGSQGTMTSFTTGLMNWFGMPRHDIRVLGPQLRPHRFHKIPQHRIMQGPKLWNPIPGHGPTIYRVCSTTHAV